jgi:hypothetical protein
VPVPSFFVINEITGLQATHPFSAPYPLDMDLFEVVDFYANFYNGVPDIHQRSLALSPFHSKAYNKGIARTL